MMAEGGAGDDGAAQGAAHGRERRPSAGRVGLGEGQFCVVKLLHMSYYLVGVHLLGILEQSNREFLL